MSQVYTARRRTAQDHTQAAAPASQGRQAAPGLGADAQSFGMGSRLEELMQERMRQHFLDNQIPEAEREADQLASAAQGARTPEEVKARMGEQLGADFSGVRFHTDSGAFRTAEDISFSEYDGIAENPHNVQIEALEAANLPASLPDLDFAVINGNYAIPAGIADKLIVTEDAAGDAAQVFANIIAVRAGDETRPEIVALVEALKSDDVKAFIEEKYEGSVLPVA